MRKATFLLSVIFILIIINSAESQIRFGPKVGVTVSKMYINTSNTPLYEVIPGFEVGGVANIPVPNSDHLSFQPALLLITKGYKYQIGDFKTVSRPMYVEIPLNAMYNFEIENLIVYGGFGPYIGYGIGGNNKVTTKDKSGNTVNTKDKINWGPSDTDIYKPFDFGANINVAFEYNNFLAGFNYSLGLANVSSKGFISGNGGGAGTDVKLKNRTYNFTIGYLFGGE